MLRTLVSPNSKPRESGTPAEFSKTESACSRYWLHGRCEPSAPHSQPGLLPGEEDSASQCTVLDR